jgi:hypothetical protein
LLEEPTKEEARETIEMAEKIKNLRYQNHPRRVRENG